MVRSLIIFIVSVFISACGGDEYHPEDRKVEDTGFKVVCVDGVQYLTYSSLHQYGVVGHFKPDGSLYTCETEEIK